MAKTFRRLRQKTASPKKKIAMRHVTQLALILFFGFLFLSNKCSKTKGNNQQESIKYQLKRIPEAEISGYKKDFFLLSMERTTCFGSCPSYQLIIYDTGIVVYNGKYFVDSMGYFYGYLSLKEIEKIKKKANAIHFFELEDRYPMNTDIVDLPATITILNMNGQAKKIINKNYETPPALIQFENLIDSLSLRF